MKFGATIYLLTVCAFSSYGQINIQDLFGEWLCENNDSLYYKSEYITLYNDSTFIDQSGHCKFIEWTIEPGRFLLTNLNKCVDAEEMRMSMTLLKHGIALGKVRRKQVLELTMRGSTYETFIIIAFQKRWIDNNAREVKSLKLKRVKSMTFPDG